MILAAGLVAVTRLSKPRASGDDPKSATKGGFGVV